MDGLIIIDKPSDITSHDVIKRVRKILDMRKVGHTGTLDPLATGVLPVCLGKATKLTRFLQADDKEYITEMTLGIMTDTYDSTGEIIEQKKCHFSEAEIKKAFQEFKGTITQIPPKTSALKINGTPMYQLAREGKEFEPKPRAVEIKEIILLKLKDQKVAQENQVVNFKVKCSKGTYIRSLCSDIGRSLGSGAMLSGLRRTRSGIFHLDEAITTEKLAEHKSKGMLDEVIIPIEDAMSNYPRAVIKDEATFQIKNGVPLSSLMIEELGVEIEEGAVVCVVDKKSNLLAAMKATADFSAPGLSNEVVARPLHVFSRT